MSTVKHNDEETISFLKKFEPKGPWHLFAKVDGKMPARTFWPNEEAEVRKWLEKHNGQYNMYVSVNPPMRTMTKKSEKEDLLELRWLHVDLDPRSGEDVAKEQKRIETLLSDKWPESLPKPTLKIFSGGGYWVLWRLETPAPINGDLNSCLDLERYNIQIANVLGGDNCFNADRIMRLPGTLNIPDANKRAKGRVTQLATVVEFNDTVYDLEQFTKSVQVDTESKTGKSLTGPTRTIEVSDNIQKIDNIDFLKSQYNLRDRLLAIVAQGSRARDIYGSKEFGKDDSRSGWLWEGVCGLVKAEVPDDVIYSLLMDPEWGISESIVDKGNSAGKHAKRIIARAKDVVADPILADMNARFAVIGSLGGKCRIVEEVPDLAMGRSRLVKQTFEDFHNRFSNERVEVQTKDGMAYVPKGKWWTGNSRRRQYDGLVFAPEGEVEGMYNLWRGFSFEPRPGDCSLFLQHLKDNICSGKQDHYDYLIKWMARVIQKPEKPGEVAIVLRGEQGTGKSITAKIFGALMGRHFLHISDSRHLIGNFNSHLRDVLFCLADEAFFAGDKKHESVLKTIVTEPTLLIEGKGIDAETARNCIHLMMASNSNWVIPAGDHERRYFVLDVSSSKRQNSAYFKDMMKQMENGGYNALMLHLSTMNLEGFVVQEFPRTDALATQQDYTLTAEESWWYEKLKSGQLTADSNGWPESITKEELFKDWIENAKNLNVQRRVTETAWWIFMNQELGDPSYTQKLVNVTEKDPQTGIKTHKKTRRYILRMPSLKAARALWEVNHGKRNWNIVMHETDAELPMSDPDPEEPF